jgi:DNA topoisomerase VI subunit B
VFDNGPGIAAETVERLLDLSSRTSARSRYLWPTRGAQGQALATILVMPYALAPGSGAGVTIEAHGATHRIAVHVNKLTGEPKLIREVTVGSVKNGTKVTVAILEDATDQFLPLAAGYVAANPHLALSLRTPDDEHVYAATDTLWTKWLTRDPTSPHWYSPEAFGKLVAACVVKDQESGQRRLLQDLLGQFDGLSSTQKRSKVLASLNLNRAYLDDLLRDGELDQSAVAVLLVAMQAETRPVKPERLGIISESNIRRRISGDGFQYAKKLGVDAAGFPYIIEGAFACGDEDGDEDENNKRLLITAANFGTSPSLTFKLSEWTGARDVLASRSSMSCTRA